MALSNTQKLDVVFKALVGRESTYTGKAWYEEFPAHTTYLHTSEIYADDIPETPPATDTDVIKVFDQYTLTKDPSVPNNRCWKVCVTPGDPNSGVYTHFVHPRFGQGYTARIYDANGTEITTTALKWIFIYETGVLIFEEDPIAAGYAEPLKITAYQYIGKFASDGGLGGAAPGGPDKSVQYNDSGTLAGSSVAFIQTDAAGEQLYLSGERDFTTTAGLLYVRSDLALDSDALDYTSYKAASIVSVVDIQSYAASSGYNTALFSSSLVKGSNRFGGLYGIQLYYGISDDTTSVVLDRGYGIYIGPYKRSGSIGTFYDLYIAAPILDSATINGPHFAIYQAYEDGINYFRGLIRAENVIQLHQLDSPSTYTDHGTLYVRSTDKRLHYINPDGTDYAITPDGSANSIQVNYNNRFRGYSDFVYTPSNRLGIGTSTPTHHVHIVGNDRVVIDENFEIYRNSNRVFAVANGFTEFSGQPISIWGVLEPSGPFGNEQGYLWVRKTDAHLMWSCNDGVYDLTEKATPGGDNRSVQFNDNGTFGGSTIAFVNTESLGEYINITSNRTYDSFSGSLRVVDSVSANQDITSSQYYKTVHIGCTLDTGTYDLNDGSSYIMSLYLTSNVNGSGSLFRAFDSMFQYGITASDATVTVERYYGLYLVPYVRSGTINTLFDLYIDSVASGGTLNNHFAIYQADTDAVNYYAGTSVFNKNLKIRQTDSPETPTSEYGTLYHNSSDGHLYWLNDNGETFDLCATSSPGGPDRAIQFNQSGSFSGLPNFQLVYSSTPPYMLVQNSDGILNQNEGILQVKNYLTQDSEITDTVWSRSVTISRRNTLNANVSNGHFSNLWVQHFTQGSGQVHSIINLVCNYGIYATDATNTIDAVTGISVTPYVRSGTVNTVYGIYLNYLVAGGTIGNYYPIYQVGNSYKSIFEGKLGIGSGWSDFTETLRVQGNTTIRGDDSIFKHVSDEDNIFFMVNSPDRYILFGLDYLKLKDHEDPIPTPESGYGIFYSENGLPYWKDPAGKVYRMLASTPGGPEGAVQYRAGSNFMGNEEILIQDAGSRFQLKLGTSSIKDIFNFDGYLHIYSYAQLISNNSSSITERNIYSAIYFDNVAQGPNISLINATLEAYVGGNGPSKAVRALEIKFGQATPDNVSTASQLTEASGIRITPITYGGSINDLFVIRLDELQNPNGVSYTIGNYYALYQADSNAKNYFAGSILVGATDSTALDSLKFAVTDYAYLGKFFAIRNLEENPTTPSLSGVSYLFNSKGFLVSRDTDNGIDYILGMFEQQPPPANRVVVSYRSGYLTTYDSIRYSSTDNLVLSKDDGNVLYLHTNGSKVTQTFGVTAGNTTIKGTLSWQASHFEFNAPVYAPSFAIKRIVGSVPPDGDGYYRIAHGNARCFGIFKVHWYVSGFHGHALIAVGMDFNRSSGCSIVLLSKDFYGTIDCLSKVRVLYKSTYDEMYVDFDFNNPHTSNNLTVIIEQLARGQDGWDMEDSLQPSQVPTDYNEYAAVVAYHAFAAYAGNRKIGINFGGTAYLGDAYYDPNFSRIKAPGFQPTATSYYSAQGKAGINTEMTIIDNSSVYHHLKFENGLLVDYYTS